MGSRLAGLHLKGALAGKFTISRSWLVPRGAVSPESARPQGVKASDRKAREWGYYINTMHRSLAEERIGRLGLIIHVKKKSRALFYDWLMNQQCAIFLFI